MARERSLERTQVVPVPLEHAFAFFADPWNLEAITPPWLRFRIVEAPPVLEDGSLLRYRLRLFGLPVNWLTEISDWRPPYAFTDVQLDGPYRGWIHTHRLGAVDGGTEIRDEVRYCLPLEPLASLAAPYTVERWLDSIFDYRMRRIAAIICKEPLQTVSDPDRR
jgi:ligand-binding SRPBCC domain-containing protein